MNVLDKKTGEIFEGNPLFFQFREHNFKLIRKLNEKSRIAANLFFFLVENMDKRTNSLIVSQEALSEVLGCTKMSVYTATKLLTTEKYVSILKSGVNNVYCVNADIVWTKRHDELYHARFNTAVYLTSSEQDEEQRIKIKKTFEKIVEVEPLKKTVIQQKKLAETEVSNAGMQLMEG